MTNNHTLENLLFKYPKEGLINLYDGDDEIRYIIGVVDGRVSVGQKLFVVIGMNPSTANKIRSDRTVNSLIKHYDELRRQDSSYVGWILFNLYPERITNLDETEFSADSDLVDLNV